jgi:hypothetical protein
MILVHHHSLEQRNSRHTGADDSFTGCPFGFQAADRLLESADLVAVRMEKDLEVLRVSRQSLVAVREGSLQGQSITGLGIQASEEVCYSGCVRAAFDGGSGQGDGCQNGEE